MVWREHHAVVKRLSLLAPDTSSEPDQMLTDWQQLPFPPDTTLRGGLEGRFDIAFTARLAVREKQIQQSYRPVIGVHKWFARRPGTLFRSLLLSEFNGSEPISSSFWHAHRLRGVIADPFMGGGTPILEANRLGFSVIGTDINPMAYWVVRQSLAEIDLERLESAAAALVRRFNAQLGRLYVTRCTTCNLPAAVKYFLWVKTQRCPGCHATSDLFPGYLVAEAGRHPQHVVACSTCGGLNEFNDIPRTATPRTCIHCQATVSVDGPARRNRITCSSCGLISPYPLANAEAPQHRMWALEYHCASCKPNHVGRFFKAPDVADAARYEEAVNVLNSGDSDLPIPDAAIPPGDETTRLHRWGYRRYRELFNDRQLLGLGTLLKSIIQEPHESTRHALLTVFSDFLRYQNMLCRYDTYALKCQDIFSVHGFPVGLVQCENSIVGTPRVGSGSFIHFVEKFLKAKRYCLDPFETRSSNGRKTKVPITGERISARFVDTFPDPSGRQASIHSSDATSVVLPPNSLDGVFTDPPYFDNVQYAELMDFCFVWLKLGLSCDVSAFRVASTRSSKELTGNVTEGRDLEHFSAGLSAVFRHYASALKYASPFVFTYHHNEPSAYGPVVVAMLDAGLVCSSVLPAPSEMGASMHIAGTKSSVLDSVFVCRRSGGVPDLSAPEHAVVEDAIALQGAGLRLTDGDLRCLASGHIARTAVNRLSATWDVDQPLATRLASAQSVLGELGTPVLSHVLGNDTWKRT